MHAPRLVAARAKFGENLARFLASGGNHVAGERDVDRLAVQHAHLQRRAAGAPQPGAQPRWLDRWTDVRYPPTLVRIFFDAGEAVAVIRHGTDDNEANDRLKKMIFVTRHKVCVAREDRSVLDLLTANYTFMNERLARHYGIPNVYGAQFRRVALGPELAYRSGLLGQGSVLSLTWVQNFRTSPVKRGVWVLENILGTQPPEPPPNVPPLEDTKSDKKILTLLEQMTMHRQNEQHYFFFQIKYLHIFFEKYLLIDFLQNFLSYKN